MRARPLVPIALFASSVLLSLGAVAPDAGAAGHGPHMRVAKGSAPAATGQPPLVYNGGKLLPSSKTYAIWWGPTSGFPSDARTGMERLLGGFGGSSYLAIANQYMAGGAAAQSTFVQSLVDTSTPPAHSPSTATIVGEVAKVLSAHGLAPDPTAIYFVYTSNFPHVRFCAWHAGGTIGTTTVQVAYMPNSSNITGCDPGNLFDANTYSEGTRSVADSTAHEFMEATTDPVPVTGWADKNGQEIGDKCNFVYQSAVKLANKSVWQLQEEWSNAAGGCVQTGP